MANAKKGLDIEVKRSAYGGTGKNKVLFCDVIINGVTIYGCRIVDGKKGEFVAFPSHKSEKDDKYYNYAWVDLDDDDTEEIIKQAKKLSD